ncbi:MAG TPA: FtsX-like permease family protein, partial [Burkholderiales bacterium]|nr:FtsX-like permease family protein [Burkholderiales bacterium]
MRLLREFGLALRLLLRDGRAGELFLIGVAVVIAVASVTAIDFFTDRVHRALNRQANQLLGADLVVAADHSLPREFEAEALRRGLAVTRMMRFPSMAAHGDRNALSSIKVVAAGYPLRGEMRIADRLYAADHRAGSIPEPGTIWVDERLFAQLGLAMGDSIDLGTAGLKVTAILTQEPDSAIGFINAGPRIILNEADVAATGLVQPGSRINYRLQIAGASGPVEAYREWVQARLQPGQRVEGIRDARPEIRAALDRAEKFLNLAALISVVLAAVAIALAARRFLQRHLDGCAMMRCLGASQGLVVRLYVVHFMLLGLVAGAIGCLLGVAAQLVLAHWLGGLVAVELPAPGMLPALHGLATGLALLLGFALPPLASLGKVSTLRVLRRELGAPGGAGLAGYALGFAMIGGMILWKAHDPGLGGLVFGGFAAAMLGAGTVAWILLRLLSGLRSNGVSWRFGVANLRRRTLGSVIQIVAMGIGIMALLTLTLIRGDLLKAWQTSLPPEAPNRFVINIQSDQLEPLARFFAARGIARPAVFPMVRGRLVRINDRDVSSADYNDERARRLIDREFNLSWAAEIRPDNRIVSGRWWGGGTFRKDQFSVEEGIAGTLRIRLGDTLAYDIAGNIVTGTVTSLRKVDWDTFNVNFFVIAPPGLLDNQPASYITSFYLPPGNVELLNALVRQFPNFLLIDVAQVMAQVQKMMDQVARAVQFVFLFTLLAGLAVLYAAISSTQDERLYRAAIMRTLGASRGQLVRAGLAEFALIGALAGLIAAAGANALGSLLAFRILNLS